MTDEKNANEKPPLEFDKAWEPPKTEESFQKRRLFFVKLLALLSTVVATVLFGMGVGVYSLRQPASWVCLPQRLTVWPGMGSLDRAIDEYKEVNGSFPLSLEDIYVQEKRDRENDTFENWARYRAVDGWKNPMIYISDGKTWELLSYGADGKPGGIGLDADLRCSDSVQPQFGNIYPDHVPTIRQILASQHFGASMMWSALVGVIAVIGGVKELFSSKDPVNNVSAVVGRAIAIAVGSFVSVAFLVYMLSIASGH